MLALSDDDDDDDFDPGPASALTAAQRPVAAPVRPTVGRSRIMPRHWFLALSFILFVLLPVGGAAFYLWTRAADQYASTVGFSVRREEMNSTMDLLGGLTGLSSSSSSDTDILYEFLQSQKLVSDMQAELDLRRLWSLPENDPVFRFHPEGSIEDLVAYWQRMVRISYDGNSGLIEVKVLAFDPGDATRIAQTLFRESSDMINGLSAIAREDAVRYAREELEKAQIRLKAARENVRAFRMKSQLVDPSTDLQSQAGLLGSLQNQLAAAQIELNLLTDSVPKTDPRRLQAERRISVIENLIATERRKVGLGSSGEAQGDNYAAIVSEYESLSMDMEFSEKAYLAALASYDASQAEARRKSRYLAAHIMPTSAEMSRYPQRWTILGLLALFASLVWAISALVVYSLRDRK
jgi:capsular polysaccharide transport system permease protein